MIETAELAAIDRESYFELGVEARFPLHLTSTRPSMWQAYEASLDEVWDPEDQTIWNGFDADRYAPEARQAAALVWSHRAWVEHSAIAESEAVLVRACLEPGVSADFKYCVSMRAVERARSTDLCYLIASRLYAYHSGPRTEHLERLLDDELVRRVLHKRCDLDAYLGAHLVAQSSIDLRSWERARANSDEPLAGAIDLVLRDKARMLEVAWLQLADAAANRSEAERRLIAANINHVLLEEEGRGRQLPALLDPCPDAVDLSRAHQDAAVGLGGVVPSDQRDVFDLAVAELGPRMAGLGIDLDTHDDLAVE